jgi:hypothetical protein
MAPSGSEVTDWFSKLPAPKPDTAICTTSPDESASRKESVSASVALACAPAAWFRV